MKRFFILFLTLALVVSGFADERILDYDSRIVVNPDSSMRVTETIKVRAEGKRIRRGIYRDFPTDYLDKAGNRIRVRFNVISVRRNANAIRWSVERRSNGWRVYLGSKSRSISPGVYTYELTYQTNRQLGYFKDHDELYWNTIGQGWAFPIDHGKATVILPEGARDKILERSAYTGSWGSKQQNCTISVNPEGNTIFETTEGLAPTEGMTIVVLWPKGFVHEPTGSEKAEMLFKDNLNLVAGLVGLILLLVYYMFAWIRVGRDPAAGPIVPMYEPPDNLSPAAMRYIEKMGFDKKAMSAAILNLAVKGMLRIEEDDGDYTLVKVKSNQADLSPEESKLFSRLLISRKSILLDNSNATTIQSAMQAFQRTLKTHFMKKYFKKNMGWFVPGVLLSILIVVGIAALSRLAVPAMFMSLWLAGWTAGVLALGGAAFSSWKSVIKGGGGVGTAIGMTLFALPFLAGEVIGVFVLTQSAGLFPVLMLLALLSIDSLFYWLLKAPTLFGRREMDKIEGFKLFLSVSEKNELNFRTPIDKTPELFEKYLPYALALNVENKWAEKFASVLNTELTPEQGGYRPGWYSGTANWGALGAAGFASSLSSSFSSAVSSSSVPPGSSSGGGGGGFSGGGGGGGGGGGF
ncbi:MAG: DUF2207 domain-containing protein [Acidobacteria bacterium]|nr:DUF2207 domain-containing protein [Acidobacteriota bacterium]